LEIAFYMFIVLCTCSCTDRSCKPYLEFTPTLLTSCLLNKQGAPSTNEISLNQSVVKKQVTHRLELKIRFVFNSKFFTGISETYCAFITVWILQKKLLCYVCKENICHGWTHVVSHFVDRWVFASTDALTSCYIKNSQKMHLNFDTIVVYQMLFMKTNEYKHKCGSCK